MRFPGKQKGKKFRKIPVPITKTNAFLSALQTILLIFRFFKSNSLHVWNKKKNFLAITRYYFQK